MTKDKAPETAPAVAIVHLESPISRIGGEITSINLRKPTAGELRGLSLVELAMMNTDALQKLLPRITIPTLTEVELQKMSPADFVQIATEVAGFLVPASRKEPQQ